MKSNQNKKLQIQQKTPQLHAIDDNNNRDIVSDDHKPNDHQSDLKTNPNLSQETKERYISFINRLNGQIREKENLFRSLSAFFSKNAITNPKLFKPPDAIRLDSASIVGSDICFSVMDSIV